MRGALPPCSILWAVRWGAIEAAKRIGGAAESADLHANWDSARRALWGTEIQA